MARLILIDGPPACGKSTLARRYVDEHPSALDLDIDLVRDLLGRRPDHRDAAGLLAREIALAGARVHLAAGHDVVVPQFLARIAFVDRLHDLADEVGAAFVELVLLDRVANVLARYARRSRTEPASRSAGPGELTAMYDTFMSFVATRPHARTIAVHDGDVDRTYRDLLDRLG